MVARPVFGVCFVPFSQFWLGEFGGLEECFLNNELFLSSITILIKVNHSELLPKCLLYFGAFFDIYMILVCVRVGLKTWPGRMQVKNHYLRRILQTPSSSLSPSLLDWTVF